MRAVSNVIFALAGLAVAVMAITVFATIGLAVLGGVVVAGIASAVAVRVMKPKARMAPGVRRDAQGIVIDM